MALWSAFCKHHFLVTGLVVNDAFRNNGVNSPSTPAGTVAGCSALLQPDGGVYPNLSQCAQRPPDPEPEQQGASRRIVPQEAVNMTKTDTHEH